MLKTSKLNLVIFLLMPLLWTQVSLPFKIHKTLKGTCTRVVDGDTAVVDGKIIRLKYIDAPEKKQLSVDGIPIGKMSKSYLKRLIEGEKVVVKYYQRGKYGRIIGEVFLEGVNVNKKIIENGMAVLYQADRWEEVQFLAQIKQMGIYKTFGFLRPKKFRAKKKRLQKK